MTARIVPNVDDQAIRRHLLNKINELLQELLGVLDLEAAYPDVAIPVIAGSQYLRPKNSRHRTFYDEVALRSGVWVLAPGRLSLARYQIPLFPEHIRGEHPLLHRTDYVRLDVEAVAHRQPDRRAARWQFAPLGQGRDTPVDAQLARLIG